LRWKNVLRIKVIKAISLNTPSDLERMKQFEDSVDAVLVEGVPGQGRTCDWGLAAEAVKRLSVPLVLAGGLNADNVKLAISAVMPYAVDVSSGVEVSPGQKDSAKIDAFISATTKNQRIPID
jgi:phosphoribosylanthranilate isomerase